LKQLHPSVREKKALIGFINSDKPLFYKLPRDQG